MNRINLWIGQTFPSELESLFKQQLGIQPFHPMFRRIWSLTLHSEYFSNVSTIWGSTRRTGMSASTPYSLRKFQNLNCRFGVPWNCQKKEFLLFVGEKELLSNHCSFLALQLVFSICHLVLGLNDGLLRTPKALCTEETNGWVIRLATWTKGRKSFCSIHNNLHLLHHHNDLYLLRTL